MSTAELTGRLATILAERCGVTPSDAVLVGVSGGADSVALLELLCALNERGGWRLRLHVAHLNHRLRGASADADADFVADLCRRRGLPCTIESADVAQRARLEGDSVEQVGRQCRFELFERLCTRYHLDCVALGHHADDQVETILHRIVRGTGLRGLGGMRFVRPLKAGSTIRLIRPLLAFTRAELRDWLAAQGIPFRRDASNRLPDYTRNRIRHELLPLLRSRFNPQADAALRRLAEQAADVYAYLAAQASECRQQAATQVDRDRVELDRLVLTGRPRVIQAEAVRQVLAQMGMPERDLSYAHLCRVVNLAAAGAGTQTVQLPAGFQVRRSYDRLVFERVPYGESLARNAATPSGWQVEVAPAGRTPLGDSGLEMTIDRIPAGRIGTPQPAADENDARQHEAHLDADAVQWPLTARTPRPGDRFTPLGMTGTKKLSDFLIDAKVAPADRKKVVVLCDRDGPVWVVGHRIAHRVRRTDATRTVLRIRVRPVGCAAGGSS